MKTFQIICTLFFFHEDCNGLCLFRPPLVLLGPVALFGNRTAPFPRQHAKQKSFFICFYGFVLEKFGCFVVVFFFFCTFCQHLGYNSCDSGQAERRENLLKVQTLSKKGNYQIENFHSPRMKNSLKLKQHDWKPALFFCFCFCFFNWLLKSIKSQFCK